VQTSDVLIDGYGRIRGTVHRVCAGLSADDLAFRPAPHANPIGWLVWHLTRVQDDHVSEIAGRPQAWTAEGWIDRFGLPFPPEDVGFGHRPDQVAQVRPESADLLVAYHDVVHDRTVAYLETIDAAELDRIIDRRWNPPVTVGVRLVSVLDDDIQHAGQACYVRGLLQPGWDPLRPPAAS